MPRKYNEWKLDTDGSKIKVLRTVSIDDKDADMLNTDSAITKLLYEPAIEKKDTKPEPEPESEQAAEEQVKHTPQRRKRN